MFRVILAAENPDLYTGVRRILSGLIDEGKVQISYCSGLGAARIRSAHIKPDLILVEEGLSENEEGRLPEGTACLCIRRDADEMRRIAPEDVAAAVEWLIREKEKQKKPLARYGESAPVRAGILMEPSRYGTGELASRAKRYIGEHYCENCTLESISQKLFVSRSHLSYVFRRETGQTVGEYVTAYRLSRAAELLTGTTLRIKEVATLSGFHNLPYFSKCFRQQYGRSPSAYRRERNAGFDKRV